MRRPPLSLSAACPSQEDEDDDEDKLQDKNAGDFQDVKRRVRTAGGGASITVRPRPPGGREQAACLWILWRSMPAK